MTPCRIPSAVALLLFIATAGPLAAQPASQHGTVSQMVNETLVTLEYDRPVARGRALFGELVEYDVVWTPGANRATWIEFSEPVELEGAELAAGRYGIWTVPGEAEWEVVLVSDWDTHHSFFPFEAEVARVRVQPTQASHMETLAFYFPVVGPREATLVFHWGTTVVPMTIVVGD